MRKIGYLFMLLVTIVACSSDDNSSESTGRKLKSLKMEASADAILLGEELVFTVKDSEGNMIQDGEVKANGKRISNKHVFDKAGRYEIIATRKGSIDSNTVNVNVVDKKKSKLTLEPSKERVLIGSTVTFKVLDFAKERLRGMSIVNVETNKELENGEFKATKAGVYKFIAKGSVYTDSDEFSVIVLDEEANSVKLNGVESLVDGLFFNLNYTPKDKENPSAAQMPFVAEVEPGVYGNYYTMIVRVAKSDKFPMAQVRVHMIVENPNIEVDAKGNITEYGERSVPSRNTKFRILKVESKIKGYELDEQGADVGDFKLHFYGSEFETAPYFNAYFGNVDLTFSYKSKKSNFSFEFEYGGTTLLQYAK